MNKLYKFFIHFYCLGLTMMVSAGTAATPTAATLATPGGDPNSGTWYINEFGPLNSNYSMGDFVRYTVTTGTNAGVDPLPKFTGKGLNLYYGIADIPYAQDIFQYGTNAFNLYNFVGYLFAGYAALNINPASLTTTNWLTSFRQSGQLMTGSLGFDNNPLANYTIQLVDFTERKIDYVAARSLGWSTGSLDTGQYLSNAEFGFGASAYWLSRANASCAWSSKSKDGQYVLAVPSTNSLIKGYVAPYGQYFGARLAHILGAVVNDIPKSTNVVTMMPSNAASPVPQMALMNGGPYATAAVAPAGITTPSTAHFGSMQNYLTDMSINIAPGLKSSVAYSYLQNHILPTVARLATLCSYAISSSSTPAQNNLIEINSQNVTAYDNGVVLAIQNNTGDGLQVNQVTSAGKNSIGALKRDMNYHFLHTASLMNGVTAVAGSAADPLPTNLIEIQDLAAKANAYLYVLNADQLQALVTALNGALATVSGSSEYSFSYNQGNTYSQPANAQYLVLLNFDPTTIATTTADINEVLMYRIQAINIAEFQNKPYFVTLQIDRSIIGNGLSNNQMIVNSQGPAILYPSIVSVKTCLWTNPYDRARGNGFYSSMPLLLIPDSILSSGISGVSAHYGIWLMSYAAALTEFQFNCAFGDTMNCLMGTFKLFDNGSESTPARVVIDASGILNSGQTLSIFSDKRPAQIMASDVWDFGNDFHQDIPILNVYQNGNQIVANQKGGDFTNFEVTFKNLENVVKKSDIFADVYDAPYQNIMLFSLSTSDLQAGVVAVISQPVAKQYHLEFQDSSGNVLAVQKIAMPEAANELTVTFGFLNDQDLSWSSVAIVPMPIISQLKVGEKNSFRVKIAAGKSHKFIIEPMTK